VSTTWGRRAREGRRQGPRSRGRRAREGVGGSGDRRWRGRGAGAPGGGEGPRARRGAPRDGELLKGGSEALEERGGGEAARGGLDDAIESTSAPKTLTLDGVGLCCSGWEEGGRPREGRMSLPGGGGWSRAGWRLCVEDSRRRLLGGSQERNPNLIPCRNVNCCIDNRWGYNI
jgi:hypothetical protein